jgi:hypothetical protein
MVTVVAPAGHAWPLLMMAARTRSLVSRTPVSGRPVIRTAAGSAAATVACAWVRWPSAPMTAAARAWAALGWGWQTLMSFSFGVCVPPAAG